MDDRGRALPWIYHSVRGGAQAGSVKLWLLLGLPDKAVPFFRQSEGLPKYFRTTKIRNILELDIYCLLVQPFTVYNKITELHTVTSM